MRKAISILGAGALALLCACSSPLIRAAAKGRTQEVAVLLDRGAKIETQGYGPDGTALVAAAREGHLDTVKLLLDRGADTRGVNAFGTTALHCAAAAGSEDMVRLLLAKGADAGARNSVGATPLMNAAEGGFVKIVKLLLDAGAQVDQKLANDFSATEPGFTALMYAARSGHAEVVKMLLDHGADPGLMDAQGRTALALADSQGQSRVAKLLRPAEPIRTSAAAASGGVSKTELEAMVESKVADSLDAQRRVAQEAKPVFSSEVDRPGYATPENPGHFAVIVGVEKYSAGLPDAQFAERDAQAVRDHLIAMGVPPRNIKFLIGSQATKGNIEAYVQDWLPRIVKPSSRVFFYFSGHGAPEPASRQAFLVPWDGNPNFLAKTAYPLKRLYKDLGVLKAGQVIVALDSCFSGAGGRSVLAEGSRPLVTQLDTSVASDDRIVLLAAASSQEVTSTLKDQGHGIFTYYLLKGLAGDARDRSGAVTVRGLYDYFRPKVQDAASMQGREQTPVLEGIKSGEDLKLR